MTADDRPTRVLVVEDEPSYAEALQVGLRSQGFDVTHLSDGASALSRFDELSPDVVLLDIMLPGMSGLDVCRELRLKTATPIVMLTALSEEIDAVVGLEVGADDYVTKPFRMRELVARLRAVLRRAEPGHFEEAAVVDDPDVLAVGSIRLDEGRHECHLDDQEVSLPRKEFELLRVLMSNPGRVMTRDVLIEKVWGWDYEGDTKTLDVHIKRLRRKLEADPSSPERILTVRGVGYKLSDNR